MLANLRSFSEYSGLILFLILIVLAGIARTLGHIGVVVANFYQDYRTVNRMAERERFEDDSDLN